MDGNRQRYAVAAFCLGHHRRQRIRTSATHCRCSGCPLHLVHVEAKGIARFKLRPRFEMNGDQLARRIDTTLVYDAPPTIEMLNQEAARNHENEGAFHA